MEKIDIMCSNRLTTFRESKEGKTTQKGTRAGRMIFSDGTWYENTKSKNISKFQKVKENKKNCCEFRGDKLAVTQKQESDA